MRGDLYELAAPRGARGDEQQGGRFAVVLQSDDLLLSTVLVAPTSTSARPAIFKPEVEILGTTTRVLVEQTTAVDPARLGRWVGRLSHAELHEVGEALLLALALD